LVLFVLVRIQVGQQTIEKACNRKPFLRYMQGLFFIKGLDFF